METDRQTDRQTETDRQTKTDRDRDLPVCLSVDRKRHAQRHTERHRDREKKRETETERANCPSGITITSVEEIRTAESRCSFQPALTCFITFFECGSRDVKSRN